jgi:hypothetical protein
VEPVEQEPEELSVDLLARIGPVLRHSRGHRKHRRGTIGTQCVPIEWRAGRDSNPRPSGSKLVEHPGAGLRALEKPFECSREAV